jgi:hypothetical protein
MKEKIFYWVLLQKLLHGVKTTKYDKRTQENEKYI